MCRRIGRHPLEPRSRPSLFLAPVLRGGAGAIETRDQVVADPLELGHVRDMTLRPEQGMGGLAGLAGVARVGGELCLETGDLPAELLPAHSLVGRAVGNVGIGRGGLAGSRAGGVDRPGEVPGVDAVLTGVVDRIRGEALEVRRAGGVLRDERPEAVARRDQAVVHQAAVDRPRRVDVHAGPAGELADARQAVAGGQLPARDQDPEPPGELGADRQVVGTSQIRCQAGRRGGRLGGLCHCASTLALLAPGRQTPRMGHALHC